MDQTGLHLFEGFGIELEYMIVGKNDLNILPIADQLIHAVAGDYISEVEMGPIAWSNELVLHVIELKTNGPSATLNNLASQFHSNVIEINKILANHNACLLPTGAHPWMDPFAETKLWPHGYNEIYESFNRIFDCRGHGWSNLQCTHLNLPFNGDDEFGRLHTAIRLLLPIIPAISASTPILEGKATGSIDSRLTFYGQNQIAIPSIAGKIIPEVVLSRQEYEDVILNRMYRDIDKHDPEKILQAEWLNSRGAIARFDRDAIEIRVTDIQESPKMDLALIQLFVATLRHLINEEFCNFKQQCAISEDELLPIFLSTVQHGLPTPITHPQYLAKFGLHQQQATARELWAHIFDVVLNANLLDPEAEMLVQRLLQEGNLSERILRAVNKVYQRQNLHSVYGKLANCLIDNGFFSP